MIYDIETVFYENRESARLTAEIRGRLVVGYLTADFECEDPMTSCDGEGRLISEANEISQRLRPHDYDCRSIETGGLCTTIRDLAIEQLLDELKARTSRSAAFDDLSNWLGEQLNLDHTAAPLQVAVMWSRPELIEALRLYMGTAFGSFADDVDLRCETLYPAYWRQVADLHIVPVSQYDCVTDWDGDMDDLPPKLWVPDKYALKNIGPSGDAVTYVESVLEVYRTWRDGDCYGCVVQVYDWDEKAGEWAADDDATETCWGFVGWEYARESLKADFFDPTVKRLQTQPAEAHPCQLTLPI